VADHEVTVLPDRAPLRLAVEDVSQVPVARAAAVRAARSAGLPVGTADRVALAATELAENLHRHATGGELLVLPADAAAAVTLVALDRGPGVAGFERCLVDGYSTAGTLGTGLGAVRRLARTFDAVSEPGRGTIVAAALGDPPPAAGADVAAVGFPIPGETVNGDGWTVVRRGARLVLLLADGLGHGPQAAEASAAATAAVPALADLPPAGVLSALHDRLRHTRGAAVTVAATDLDALLDGGTVHSAGFGNVSLLVAGGDGETRRAATAAGTAGVRSGGRVLEQATVLPPGGIVVLHSDGLTSRWGLTGRAELLRHSAVVVAAALLRDHERGGDDTMVVVLRAAGGGGP